MRQAAAEGKRFRLRGRLSDALAVFLGALFLRLGGNTPPFDDVYHLKRIAWSAANFPRVLGFDPDRGEGGAFCPWPPLYDFTLGVVSHMVNVQWVPPIVFALFAAGVTLVMSRYGWLAGVTAGATVALAPYLLSVSMRGHVDHHYVEPLLMLLILGATVQRRWIALGLVIAAGLLVQPALLIAAAIAFALIFFTVEDRQSCLSFLIAAAIVLAYRWTRPDGYPDSAWFLGYPHAGALTGAAVALMIRGARGTGTAPSLLAGLLTMFAFPAAAASLFTGVGFFGSDPWLSSIVEFQPMFRNRASIGTDLANLGGGAALAFVIWKRHREVSVFAIVYLVLSISSRRFLVPGIPLFAIAGALALADAKKRSWQIAFAAATLLPPLLYLLHAGLPQRRWPLIEKLTQDIRALPPGRVLAPWSLGHAIDVLGRHPVIVDNFGSMPGQAVFDNANDAMLTTHESTLLRYCRSRNVRYLVLTLPDSGLPSGAANLGVDPKLYQGTPLAERTVWWRLYRNGETIPGFRLVGDGMIRIWEIE
ncbi:MAG TPA: hypothetical protein VMS98_20275 [Thermoanaerobaculia bacterium]|nr:hypothetical protein [Thermoanaerobaculia bacterium]